MILIDQKNYQNHQLGGKAQQLFQLQERGYTIPDFCCIEAAFFEKSLDSDTMESIRQLLQRIDYHSADSLEKISREIRQLVKQKLNIQPFMTELTKAVDQRFPKTDLFSVRSSAAAEDGDVHSFAGQFETVLFVEKEALGEAIIRCVASQFRPAVLSYIHQHGGTVQSLTVTVILQEMIVGERSGILFTANPQGLLNESVVVVGNGTGDQIVEDRAPTTSYYFQLTDNQYYFDRQKEAPLLEQTELVELIALGQELKDQAGQELDIEFTFYKKQLFLLQARPITTLKKEPLVVLDNSNIVESYPGITLPLTASFIKQAYFGVFRGLAFRCVPDNQFIASYDDIFKEMLAVVNGRVYYKISNWYTLLSFLPLHKKIIPVWEEMLGVKGEQPADAGIKLPWHKRLRTYFQVLKEAKKVPQGMEQLNTSFNEIDALFQQKFHSGLSNKDILKLYQELKNKVLVSWDITLLNDLYAFIYTGLLKHQMKRMAIANYEQRTNEFIAGIGNLESMKPILALLHLAQRLIDENLKTELEQIQTDEQAKAALSSNTLLGQYTADYIRLYGDRSLEELKLETKTFRVKPLRLFQELQNYANNPSQLSNLLKKLSAGADEKNAVMENDSLSIRQRKRLTRLSEKAMLGIKNREISRLNRSRLYGMVRSLYSEMGKNLTEMDILQHPRDIFYTTLEELDALEQGEQSASEVRAAVERRKQEYQNFANLPVYSRLIYAGKEFNKYPQNINAVKVVNPDGELAGIPCSEGLVTAEILVIENPHEAGDVSEKILVTKMTDPGWVFLLTKAAGIITEKGSLLSHTAIISRELQIPAVVGVPDATVLLKSGDKVTLNGNTGKIIREPGGETRVSDN